MTKNLKIALLCASATVLGGVASAAVSPKTAPAGISNTVQVIGGNGIYTVSVNTCGQWTAVTGPLHPAGAGLNVIFPIGTSYTTLRSYSSGTMYSNGGGSTCDDLCSPAPAIVPLMNGATITGYKVTFTVNDAGRTIVFQEVINVEGPVNGTETVNNTVIRETHTVHNNGPASLSFGLRKMWDWQIGSNDGPWFGTCDTVDKACDRSMNFFANGTGAGVYPPVYRIDSDPAVALCPAGIVPNHPAGCGGNPPYLVAATVSLPTTFNPPPTPPELLQFNSWPSLTGNCWQPPLSDNVVCNGGDSAIAYFYGLTQASALTVNSGQEQAFTEYIVAAQGSCPTILQPLACSAGGPYLSTCTSATIDGGTVNGSGTLAINYTWTSSNPAVTVSPATGTIAPGANLRPVPPATATLSGAVLPCGVSSTLTLTLNNGQSSSTCTATVTFNDNILPQLVSPPGNVTVDCQSIPVAPTLTASDNCDPAPTVAFVETQTPGSCADRFTLNRTWTATDRCGNTSAHTQLVTVQDVTAPVPVAALVPVLPLPPTSPASPPLPPAAPTSVCSAAVSGTFQVTCSASDNCDPAPALSAVLRVVTHEVPAGGGPCIVHVEDVPVACGDTVLIHLVAPPCANPPNSGHHPAPPASPNSSGVQAISGESVTLVVTATDRCGNLADVTVDPTIPPASCPNQPPGSPCCAVIARPPNPDCLVCGP